MHKGLKKMKLDKGLKVACAFGLSAGIANLFQLFGVKFLKARIIRLEEEKEQAEAAQLADEETNPKELKNAMTDEITASEESNESSKSVELAVDAMDATPVSKSQALRRRSSAFLKNMADKTINRDLETEARAMDDDAADIWDNAVVYDAKSEVLYSYLQVFTACALSFAHGSNDVANAIAPLCAILAIYETGALTSTAAVPKWVLAMGAFGIVIGLAYSGK